MSGIANDTNTGRVAKVCDTLCLIEKSAKSNRASKEEVHDLLIPLLAKLGELGFYAGPGAGPDPEPVEVPAHLKKGSAFSAKPAWATIREMAENAPLKDLTVALAVFMNRVDAALEGVE